MGNLQSFLLDERIEIIGGQNVKPAYKDVMLKNGMEVRVFIKDNRIIVLPERDIMNKIDQGTKSTSVDIAKSMKILNELDKKQKILAMHYIMEGDDEKSQAAITEKSKQILFENAHKQFSSYSKQVKLPLSQLDQGFRMNGININWTFKSSVKSAISLQAINNLQDNIRIAWRQQQQADSFEKLKYNYSDLSEHIDNIQQRLSKKLNILQNQAMILKMQKGSVITSFIINIDKIQDKIEKDSNLSIHPFFEKLYLSSDDFDPNGNCDYTQKIDLNEKRQRDRRQPKSKGGLMYHKPIYCKRYGLNVWDKYEDNDWLVDPEKQWPIFYHGVFSAINNKINVVKTILTQGLIPGTRQLYQMSDCQCHINCKIPKSGVYFGQDINIAMDYANPSSQIKTKQQNKTKRYKLAFACRVHPDMIHKITTPINDVYWVAGKNEQKQDISIQTFIRPYGIVLQQVNFPVNHN